MIPTFPSWLKTTDENSTIHDEYDYDYGCEDRFLILIS